MEKIFFVNGLHHHSLILHIRWWWRQNLVREVVVGESRGGGVLHKYFGSWVQHADKIWTQSDLRFCENEGSKRYKINEKGRQLDWKSRRKLIQNVSNLLTSTFWWKNSSTLGPSISGTKYDRNKLIFFCRKRGVNRIVLRYKVGTQSDWKSPKGGSSLRNLPTMPKYGSTRPGGGG